MKLRRFRKAQARLAARQARWDASKDDLGTEKRGRNFTKPPGSLNPKKG